MFSKPIKIKDESFDPEKASEYRLFAEISPTGFRFSVMNKASDKIILLDETQFDKTDGRSFLKEAEKKIIEIPELKLGYYSRTVAIVTSKYTLVPISLFDKSKVNEFFEFNFKKTRDEEIFWDEIKNLDAAIIYSGPFLVKGIFTRIFNFKPFRLTSHISNIIEALILQCRKISSPTIAAHLSNNQLDILAIRDGKLILSNVFEIKSPQDLVYFIIHIIEQLKINPELAEIYYYGQIEAGDENHKLLSKYLPKILPGPPVMELNFSYGFEGIPVHPFFSLFSQKFS